MYPKENQGTFRYFLFSHRYFQAHNCLLISDSLLNTWVHTGTSYQPSLWLSKVLLPFSGGRQMSNTQLRILLRGVNSSLDPPPNPFETPPNSLQRLPIHPVPISAHCLDSTSHTEKNLQSQHKTLLMPDITNNRCMRQCIGNACLTLSYMVKSTMLPCSQGPNAWCRRC